MRFSPTILFSLGAIAPALVAAAPAPQDDYAAVSQSTGAASGAASADVVASSTAAQPSASSSGSCTRGRGRGGRNRWGQGRPSSAASSAAGGPVEAPGSEVASATSVTEEGATDAAEPTSTVEEVIEETVTMSQPVGSESVEFAAGTGYAGENTGGQAQPTGGAGQEQPPAPSSQAPAPPVASSAAAPAPPAQDAVSGSDAQAGFEAEMLAATNAFRAQFGRPSSKNA